MAKRSDYVDEYAGIGTFEIKSDREKLVKQNPVQLPEIYLETEGIDESAIFETDKVELGKDELEKAIFAEKEYYMPFLQDLAPKMGSCRTYKKLEEFDWKVGIDEDVREFGKVLDGEGDWERVKIPHFGEPVGLATTYYRTEFELTKEEIEKESLWICFKGVDYQATVYVNGVLVGSHTGFFAPFEFDFSLQAKEGVNTLLVVVENDFVHKGNSSDYRGESFTGDKIYAATGVGYDEPLRGWHHCPPAMGIWQDVYIEGRSKLFIHDIFVRPVSYNKAEIWLEVIGTKVEKQEISFDISIYGQNFEEKVIENMKFVPDLGAVDPNQQGAAMPTERGMNYYKIPINIPNARIWDAETPWLYQLQIKLKDDDDNLLDMGKRQFGMRVFEFDTECTPKGAFKLNGKRIKMRGVNSQGREQRCVFLKDYQTLLRDYLLAKVGNINYLRITQRPVQPEVYELCDRLGLLVQTDFPLFGCLRRNTFVEAVKQAQEMEHLIRSHPSCVVNSYINEPFAYGHNRPHRCMERHEMEMFFECADRAIHLLNPDRIIKPIDGDYDPPVAYGLPDYHCYTCWYNGHGVDLGRLHKGYWMDVKDGWNYACGEFGMEGLDPVSVMKKYYPKQWLPENDEDEWTPADIPGDPAPQLGQLHYHFHQTPKTMAEWVEASQTHQAEAMNFMVRAFRRNPKMVSYAYHLFVDAYPNGWMKAMVDVEGTPKKAFWEYRKCSAPLMVDLRTDRFKAMSGEKINVETRICNDYDYELKNATLRWQILCGDKLISVAKKEISVPAWDVLFAGYIPLEIPEVSQREIVKIQVSIVANDGKVADNYGIEIEAFPKEKQNIGKVFAPYISENFKAQIKREFEVEFVDEADSETTILSFGKVPEKAAMEKGKKTVVFNLPVGENDVFGEKINVYPCSRRPMHFVERKENHILTTDFKKDDVRFWFDEEKGVITPIVCDMFDGDGFVPILTTARQSKKTAGGSAGQWEKMFALAEKDFDGKKLIISQVNFENKLKNPVAKILFARLMRY